jgi:hypothetical protein
MDEAYKAVKKIKNPEVWENMAHMVRPLRSYNEIND